MSYKKFLHFITLNGYAVADCSGMTDRYQVGSESTEGVDCRMTPIALDCFTGLYDFIADNYNIKKDGVHVFGKSNGGLGTVMLGYKQTFPIKSLASLAGSLSIVASFRISTSVNLNYWLGQFGIDANYSYDNFLYNKQTANDIDYIVNNSDKFADYDPMLVGTDVDPKIFNRLIMDNGYNDHSMNNDQLLDIVNSSDKYLSTPMKIWHAIDDTAVPIETSMFFKRMVDNGNGECHLSILPEGVGGHHAVDTSPLAPQVVYTTKYGGDVEITSAYAELVEWFNMWEYGTM